jgi:hypothetical protein
MKPKFEGISNTLSRKSAPPLNDARTNTDRRKRAPVKSARSSNSADRKEAEVWNSAKSKLCWSCETSVIEDALLKSAKGQIEVYQARACQVNSDVVRVRYIHALAPPQTICDDGLGCKANLELLGHLSRDRIIFGKI